MHEILIPTKEEAQQLSTLKSETLASLDRNPQIKAAIDTEVQRRFDEFASSHTDIDFSETPLINDFLNKHLLNKKNREKIQFDLRQDIFSQIDNLIYVLGHEGEVLIHRAPDTGRIPSGLHGQQHTRAFHIINQAVFLASQPNINQLSKPGSISYEQPIEKLLVRTDKIQTKLPSFVAYRFYFVYEKYIASPFDPRQQGIVLANAELPIEDIVKKYGIKFINEVNGRSSNMLVLTNGQGIAPLV